ncbi:transglycosylase domain-containing protein [Clostridium sp. CF012]|uniref:transglycosylase domain-containing protein n=1 Tax=Clostridium sp. CF012 TaxID=2843319 RepID=UPI001C0C9654|nr:transglycosylase domain-containing protein [Clostridium sp. CF012]MBU3145005.1 transglycosylase domain-containing protein [Clostridium sp. CF012]
MKEKVTTQIKDKKPTPKKKKSTGRKVFKSLVFTIMFIALIAMVAMSGVVLAMVKTAPDLDINVFLKLDEPSILYDNDSKYMDEYITSERRTNISINKVPLTLRDAFISIEDSRFGTHPGIDIKRLGGAVLNDIKIKIKGSGESLQGASTITQQLVKYRMFLEDSMENRTSIKRKVQEISLSLKLEKILTKDQILEAYVNTIFLGGKAHGVEAASQQYFGKSIEKLTLKQSAFIASAAQNPTLSYNLAYKAAKSKEAFVSNRTKTVLESMLRYNKITKAQFDLAMAEKLVFSFSIKDANKMNFEFFSRPAIVQVSEDLMKTLNISQAEAFSMLMYDGLKISTTMDRNLQIASQKLIDNTVKSNKGNNPKIRAASVITDYHTGEVKTIIGGTSDEGPMTFDRAASMSFLKPPGSTIKPLTVYGPAIDTKIATASTIIEDSPLTDEMANRLGGKNNPPYNPKNSGNTYKGYLTLRDCLKYSVNVAAVKIEDMITLKTGASYGEKFGLQLDDTDKGSSAAMALGQLNGGKYLGTNPLTMATAYGVFGNNGMRTDPRLYTKVVDRDGKVLLQTKYDPKPVLSPQSAYIMYDLLRGPVTAGGTGTNAPFSDMPVRGKTGTSSDSKNLWFVGLTPYYSAAVWIGTDRENVEIQGLGSNDAALLWGKLMKVAHTNLPVKEVERPSGISSYSVSKDSGDIPSALTYADPRGNRVYSELFIDGTQPTTVDSIHVSEKVIKDPSGKYVLTSEFTPLEKIETRVFIKRNYIPNVFLIDSPYVLPTAVDTFSKKIIIPPVNVPPVTDPPITDPPITDPPVTDPPVTVPPVTDPTGNAPPKGNNGNH